MSGIAVVGAYSTVWGGYGWASEPTGSEKPGSSSFHVRCLLLTGIACGQSWPLSSPLTAPHSSQDDAREQDGPCPAM